MTRRPPSLLLVLLATLLAACAAGTGPDSHEDFVTSSSTELRIVVAQDGIRLLQSGEATAAHRPGQGNAQLRYDFRAADGHVLGQGFVDDPRALRSEWVTNGRYDQLDAWAMSGVTSLTVPRGEGDLVLYQPSSQGDREIGRLHYQPPVNGQSRQAMLDPSVDVMGSPVRLPGGDSPGRTLDVLVVGDGFRESEMAAFHAAVDNMVGTFRSAPAIQKFSDRIRVWRQDVRSQETGIDIPNKSLSRDTAFDLSYGKTSADERCTWFSSDTAALAARQLGEAAGAEVVVVIANDTGWGGCASGGMVVQTLSSDAGLVLAHELGHAVFHLADEYTYGRCDKSASAPNLSRSAKLDDLPWKSLVDAQTLPTPPNASYGAVTGAFEGAGYCPYGMYRPQLNCLMREVGKPFCTVCARELARWFDQDAAPASAESNGGEQHAPTEPSGADCGEVSWQGACAGDVLQYCTKSGVESVDCAASGRVCGWSNDNGYTDCLASPTDSDQAPPTGPSDGAEGSSDGNPPQTGCGTVTWEGECIGDELRYCQGTEMVTVDCLAMGMSCGFGNGQADCLASQEAAEDDGGADGCAGLEYEGECVGNWLTWCDGTSLVSMDCAQSGESCAWNASASCYDCL